MRSSQPAGSTASLDPWVGRCAALWGACTFLPIGVNHLCALVLLAALLVRPGLALRLARLRVPLLAWPSLLLLAWIAIAAAVGPWYPDTATRLFHAGRVILVVAMGLMLSRDEAWYALRAFLAAAVVAALIVALHHVFGLPEWALWSSLIRSRNNFSSANMIMLAIAAALFFFLGLGSGAGWKHRLLFWGAALALALTVIEHSLSRNAQVLLPALVVVGLVYQSRSWRAVAMAALLALALGAVAWQGSAATQQRFGAVWTEWQRLRAEADFTTGVGERYLMAREAWQGMRASPWVGTGVGSWLPRWRMVALETGGSLPAEQLMRHVEINNPHNEYLLAGMETGVPGMLLLVSWVGACIAAAWKRGALAGGVALVLASALTLSAFINAPLRDAAFGQSLLWLLGASLAAGSRKEVT